MINFVRNEVITQLSEAASRLNDRLILFTANPEHYIACHMPGGVLSEGGCEKITTNHSDTVFAFGPQGAIGTGHLPHPIHIPYQDMMAEELVSLLFMVSKYQPVQVPQQLMNSVSEREPEPEDDDTFYITLNLSFLDL